MIWGNVYEYLKQNGEEWGNKCGFSIPIRGPAKFILSELKSEFGFFFTDTALQSRRVSNALCQGLLKKNLGEQV